MQSRMMGWGLAIGLAVAVIGVMLFALPKTSSAQNPTTDSRKRITVVGHGETQVVPDIARVTIGVQTKAPEAQTALADNNKQMQALIDQLKAAGVPETDIQTNGFSISPEYDYTQNNMGKLIGYQVSNSVNVRLKVADTGALLDKVVAVGANNIGGIWFEVSDPAKALEAARQAAMKDARTRADQYAQAGGSSVGEVLVITENVGAASPMPMMDSLAEIAGRAVPIQPGQQAQTIDVQVTFELK